MRSYSSKRGFTFLELIFVTVILGIVSSIGASLIAKVYESYITQRALYTASAKTDLAAKQIAARLTYRISLSLIGRKLDSTYKTIDKVDPGDDYRILEWIGYDNDSFSATHTPGWSGFCDVDSPNTTRTQIFTPGSSLESTATIIGNLGGDMSSNPTDAAILFNSRDYANNKVYHIYNMGYSAGYNGTPNPPTSNTAPTISPVTSFDSGNNFIYVSDNNAKRVHDQYKLVWSAYAIVPVQQSDNPDTAVDESKLFDLELHYNYQPWKGEAYDSTAAKVKTLVKDVTVFKFQGIEDVIRFKICVQEKISGSETVNICKEKAVIR